MSKLSELINKLCPNGVEYKKIKDAFQRLRGTPITASQMKQIQNEDGEITIFAGGKTVVRAKEEDIEKANITRVPAVLVQSRGIIDFIYYDKPFTFKNEMWAYTAENSITVKYLYYVLQNNAGYFREAASGMGSLPQISLRVTEDYLIPLPPLEIQREVVEILDKFAQLTAELTAELQKRKKQYEHYRDMLLNFERGGVNHEFCGYSSCSSDSSNSRDSRDSRTSSAARTTRWVRLGEICEMKRGRVISKEYLRENKGEYPVYSSQTLNEGIFGYISTYDFEGEYLTWTTDGANAGSVFYHNGKFSITNVCGLLKSKDDKVSIKYLFYWLKREARKYVSSGMGNPKLMSNTVASISIPLPPLAEQERIVAILDRFDSLCNSLTEGLPAEIALRKKQYEYYRDKLLDFNSRSSSNSSSSSLEPLE